MKFTNVTAADKIAS